MFFWDVSVTQGNNIELYNQKGGMRIYRRSKSHESKSNAVESWAYSMKIISVHGLTWPPPIIQYTEIMININLIVIIKLLISIIF